MHQDKVHSDGDMDVSAEHQYLGMNKNIIYGLQHVLTMYGGIIAPPLIIGAAAGLDGSEIALLVAAALFVGGIATVLQTIGFKHFGAKLPIVQGVSFAGVATILAIVSTGGGLPSAFGAVIVASIIGLFLTPFFAKIIRFFPPVVTGCVITMIGISLTPVAIRWIMGGNPKAENWGDPANVGLAVMTLAIVIIFSMLRSQILRRLAILIAIVLGTILA